MSTINLSGCGFHSENQLKQTLENALEDKYDEEFVCLDVWTSSSIFSATQAA